MIDYEVYAKREFIPEMTIEEIREFVELQTDDPILSLDTSSELAEYMRQHIGILHRLIMGDLTLDDATKELGRLEL